MVSLGAELIGVEDASWRAEWVEPGTVDVETGEEIAPGWRISASDPDEPEEVYLVLHIEHAVTPNGAYVGEFAVRRLLDVLTSERTA